jgi:hypothetical protein
VGGGFDDCTVLPVNTVQWKIWVRRLDRRHIEKGFQIGIVLPNSSLLHCESAISWCTTASHDEISRSRRPHSTPKQYDVSP